MMLQASIQCCHHYHLCFISTPSVLVHHPPQLSLPFGTHHPQLQCHVRCQDPAQGYIHLLTYYISHSAFTPLHPLGLSHHSHSPLAVPTTASTPSSTSWQSPPPNLTTPSTTRRQTSPCVLHIPQPSWTSQLLPKKCLVPVSHLLPRRPKNRLVPVLDILIMLFVPVWIFSLLRSSSLCVA